MQPYRTARVHDAAECHQCGPTQPGHHLCQHPGCNEPAEMQHKRHATDAEYAALPESLRPTDGVAHQAVFVCLDHEVDPICSDEHHPLPAPAIIDPDPTACEKCGAEPGHPCTRADGNPRTAPHKTRVRANTPHTVRPTRTCEHAHRPHCEGQGACVCHPDDPAPTRPRRTTTGQPTPDLTGLTPAAPAGDVLAWLEEHGIPRGTVKTVAGAYTQDNRPALRVETYQTDPAGNRIHDTHGHATVDTRIIPIEGR